MTYLSHLIFKLNFGVNCTNSTLRKFYFCYHSIMLSVVYYEMKKMDKSQNISCYSFIISFVWNHLLKKWCSCFFVISPISVCNAISHDLDTQWKQKLQCHNGLQSNLSKQMWICYKKFKTSIADKKIKSYVNVQLRSKSCLCFFRVFNEYFAWWQ